MATPRAAWMLAADASQTCQPAASSSTSIFPLVSCSGCGAKTPPVFVVSRIFAYPARRTNLPSTHALFAPVPTDLANLL